LALKEKCEAFAAQQEVGRGTECNAEALSGDHDEQVQILKSVRFKKLNEPFTESGIMSAWVEKAWGYPSFEQSKGCFLFF